MPSSDRAPAWLSPALVLALVLALLAPTSALGGKRDRARPETTITQAPEGIVSESDATFEFKSNRERASFECQLDGNGWKRCGSPASYSDLSAGDHRFLVRARDAAGNVDRSPALAEWKIAEPEPTPEPEPGPERAPDPVPPPVIDPEPAEVTAPPSTLPGERSRTVSPGTSILSDSEAARHVRRSTWEPRPDNREANRTVPSDAELAAFRLVNTVNPLNRHITGNFTGTTDEIIQWAAWKWGLDEDLVRAQAELESNWDQTGPAGDGGLSFGLMQIKSTVSKGTYPLSSESTAFNLDYYGATIRYYYDGHADWMDYQPGHVGDYDEGDLWGSVGAWYSGNWHTAASEDYISSVKSRMDRRNWEDPGF